MKIVTPRTLSGFPEYLPAQQIAFNAMQDAIAQTFELYGFAPIETPAIELSEILLAKGGGETEQEIYRFEKGDNDMALHYDLTVPLARYVAEHEAELVFPFRRYQIQKNWRAERPQKGRFREFVQCDIDIIGSDSVLHDAEVVAVVSEIFSRLSIGKFIVRISNRKLLSGFLLENSLEKHSAGIFRLVDKLDKIGGDAVEEGLQKLGLSLDETNTILDFINITGDDVAQQLSDLSIKNDVFSEGLDEITRVLEALEAAGVPAANYKVDLKIVRGLDYYTGTVYETNLVEHPEFGSVCSGGRYNDLAGHYAKSNLPGVGISIGLTRLFAALLEHKMIAPEVASPAHILIANFGGDTLTRALEVATQLRTASIATQVYFEDTKLEKQFKYADRLKIPYVVVIGEEEVKSGKLALKEMSTGEQAIYTPEEIIEKLG